MDNVVVFSLNSSKELTEKICKKLGIKEGKIEKEVAGKIKNCEVIRYIKEKNQLFVSSIFFVSTQNGKVYKCDGRRKKIIVSTGSRRYSGVAS